MIKEIISFILIAYLCIISGLYFAQRNLIYFPDKIVAEIPNIPNVTIDAVIVEAKDGLNLRGWYIAAQNDNPTIVFFHGNASNHLNSLYKMMPFIDEGYGFLSVGYRGYGGNEGKPSEQGFYADSRAFINDIKLRGVTEDNIILYGQSIGTGVAVQMAVEYPQAKALILESPYTSLVDVAAEKYFFVPTALLLKDKFDSQAKIGGINIPTLIIHGKEDRLIPFKFGQRLFDKANEPKKLFPLIGIGHNDIPKDKAFEVVTKFLLEN